MTTNTDNEQTELKPVERIWITHYLDGEVSDYWQTAPRKFDPERDSKKFVSVEYAPVSASSAAPTDAAELLKLRRAIGWICDAADAAYIEDSNNARIHEIFNIAAQAAGITRRLPDEYQRFDETSIG